MGNIDFHDRRSTIEKGFDHYQQELSKGLAPSAPVSLTVGWVALCGLAFVVVALAASSFGVTHPNMIAIGVVVLMNVGVVWWRSYRLDENLPEGAERQAALHDIEQQDFELRLEQAKKNGALDRFNKSSQGDGK